MSLKTYHGSCHCGNVTYEADIDLSQGTAKCNCTFCLKARAWKAFIKPEAFRLKSGDALVEYHKNPEATVKQTCGTCGIRTHETGTATWTDGEPFVGIFVTTLDDASPDELLSGPVQFVDGRHDNWQNPPKETRHL